MAEGLHITAFEGGTLRFHTTGEAGSETVLALPLTRLILKVVRVPAENRDDPAAFATPLVAALSPYPDEPLTVSCETLSESEAGLVVLAGALPESSTDDVAEALDGAKLNVRRIDALALGELRGLWGSVIGASGAADARRLVVLKGPECLSLFVLDGDVPCEIRAVSPTASLRRETMLSLVAAEDFAGPRELAEAVLAAHPEAPFTAEEKEAFAAFAPVRALVIDDPDAALKGVALRTAEPGAFDLLPASWREMLEETRFKAKLRKHLFVALGVWVLAMAVLFGVPLVYGLLTDHQKTLSREHARQFREVSEMKGKVELVQKYTDHARGALEILRLVSTCLPAEGVELTNWNFKREDGVRFSGEAVDSVLPLDFVDSLRKTGVFGYVSDPGMQSSGKSGKWRFEISCEFEAREEE